MTKTLDRELAVLTEQQGYEVRFRFVNSAGRWFYTQVLFNGALIDEKPCCKSYPKAARWAKRKIGRHQRALSALGPLAAARKEQVH